MNVKLLLSCALLSNLLTLETIFGAGDKSASMHRMDKLYENNRRTEAIKSQHHVDALAVDRQRYNAVNEYQVSFLKKFQQNYQRNARIYLEQYQDYIKRCQTHGSTLKDAETPFAEANYAILEEVLSGGSPYTPHDITIQYIEFLRDNGGVMHNYASFALLGKTAN